MDVHKPKPWHGLREFLKEYLIIVIGVLTALGAEQVVEDLHWRHAVQAQREALDGEIAHRLTVASTRLIQESCIQSRLKELRIVFERHKAGTPMGLKGPVGTPTVLNGGQGVWATSAGSQAMEHMSAEERQRFGHAFQAYAIMDANLAAEVDTWSELGSLDDAAILEMGDWPALRAAYVRASYWDMRNRFYADWVLKNDAAGQKPLPFDLGYLIRLKEPVRNLCRPMLARRSPK